MWLDFKLFGNGRGLGEPFCDGVFYFLSGRFYNWIGGFGAQLQSFEWRGPKPGTRRRLFDHDFVVANTKRRWLRVRVTWCRAYQVREADELRALKCRLLYWVGAT